MDCQEIIAIVAELFDISPDNLLSKVRCRRYAEARNLAVYLCFRFIIESNSSSISKAFSRSRSAVINSFNAAKRLLASDSNFYNLFKIAKDRIWISKYKSLPLQ